MPWGKTSDRGEQRRRGDALTAVLDAGASADRGGRGSRGGAPIWVMHGEGFGLMPAKSRWKGGESTRWRRENRPCSCPDAMCVKHGYDRQMRGHRPDWHLSGGDDADRRVDVEADPDGFAVFGRYPKGMLRHVMKLRLLGDVERDDVLHVCSGTLGESERWTIDARQAARPRVVANGAALPFRDAAFRAVMLDPPYSDQYARNLYGVENPRPSWLLREAARVVAPCGRIGILHVAIPFAPAGCRLVRVYPVSTGVGFRIRALTIYEKEQPSLLDVVADDADADVPDEDEEESA